jgi:hypothetical protein
MKKFICLLILFLLLIPIVFSQHRILIRYVGDIILTPIKTSGYLFSTWKVEEFEITDSLSYVFVKQRIDSIELCADSDVGCRFPNVRQQIIVINNEEYDILSSDGVSAMEKNGRKVIFDKTLQAAINRAIDNYVRKMQKKGTVPRSP